LGCAVERFSETYAQIDVPLGKGEEWATIDAFLIKLGSIIRQMQEESIIQSADLDVAFGVAEDWVGISRTVPARTAALAGVDGIGVTITFYRTNEP